ncbi:MAG: dihydrolipoyl dehydrogenase [Gammaproteobacteria bacterium]
MSNADIKYDVLVIGAGPAGYVAAIRAAQLGLKTACIDNWSSREGKPSLGGTYINSGCIPAIALLESSKLFHLINNGIAKHGIHIGEVSLDMPGMMKRKNDIIAAMSDRISAIFSSSKVDAIHGYGRLLDQNRVEISNFGNGEKTIVTAENIILASGSIPAGLPCAAIDNEYILDSNTALNMDAVPGRLGIIGAGIIGFELGGIWNLLGSNVILLEAQETFLSAADQQIAKEAFKLYSGQGLDIRLGARVMSTKIENGKVVVEYQDREGNHFLELDKLIVATGRVPNTDKLAAPEADLLLNEDGSVHVDENCMTNLPGVYAIGDLTQLGPMLAHKGLEQGVFVAEQIAGRESAINYDIIPSVIYTDPEIAWVGQNEQTLKAIGEKFKIGVFPLTGSGRAHAMGKTEGMVKIITHAETDVILGVHIISANASELIAEGVLAMEFSASAEDLARTIHAHPTFSEAIHEAALALDGRALHMPPGA